MSYMNGHIKTEMGIMEESRHERAREEIATDAEFHRILNAFDSEFALKRETESVFDYGGCQRVVLRLIGQGSKTAAITYEMVPEQWYHSPERGIGMSLSSGSKVRHDGEEFYLDKPIIFRKRA